MNVRIFLILYFFSKSKIIFIDLCKNKLNYFNIF